MRVAIIGGGPSGLAALKYVVTAHEYHLTTKHEAILFESNAELGGVFRYKVYEDAELVSSKQLTCFSDFRPKACDTDFLSTERYVQYLEEYVTHFGLRRYIKLSTPVTRVSRRPGGGHLISYRTSIPGADGQPGPLMTWECDAIAICTGVHMTPNQPYIPGINKIPTVMHSVNFKERKQFGVDKTVVVLGTGETGVDLAFLAITAPTKQVVLCHHDGFKGAPKWIPVPTLLPILGFQPDPTHAAGKGSLPLDVGQASLFDTMYVHPLVRDSMVGWNLYDAVSKLLPWSTTGSWVGNDQWMAGVGPERYHASRLFFNKAWQRLRPYITTPHRPKWSQMSLVEKIRRSLVDGSCADPGRYVDIAPWPSHVDDEGYIHFSNNGRPEYEAMKKQRVKPDVLVLATGYVHDFPFLDRSYPHSRDADVRDIWCRDDPTVAFIGFIRPGFGAIPPLSELQIQLWLLSMAGRLPRPLLPVDEWHYHILHPVSARIQYGVEHDSYANQLAVDMGSAPGFWDVVRIGWRSERQADWWRLPVIWAAGPNYVIKYRMKGPWKDPNAQYIMTGELWETITRRHGFYGNLSLAIIPIIFFGLINLYAWVFATLMGLLVDLSLRSSRPIDLPFPGGKCANPVRLANAHGMATAPAACGMCGGGGAGRMHRQGWAKPSAKGRKIDMMMKGNEMPFMSDDVMMNDSNGHSSQDELTDVSDTTVHGLMNGMKNGITADNLPSWTLEGPQNYGACDATCF